MSYDPFGLDIDPSTGQPLDLSGGPFVDDSTRVRHTPDASASLDSAVAYAQEAAQRADRNATPANSAPAPGVGGTPRGGGGGPGGPTGNATPNSSGGQSTPMGGPSNPAALSQQAIEDYVRANYPQVAWALNDPELGPLLRTAATQGWDPAKFQGALENTNWWKSHGTAARQWAQLQSEDSAEAGRRVDSRSVDIRIALSKLGLNVGDDVIRQLATNSLTYAWSDNELRQNIGNYITTTGPLQGDLGAQAQKLKAQARGDYFVQIGDDTALQWAKDMFLGKQDDASYTAYLINQAKSRYPGLTQYIDNGVTPKQFFDPYVQQTSKLLEVAPDTVDFVDNPKYQKMTGVADPGGQLRPMTLYESANYIRGLPEYRQTNGARSEATDLAEFIGEKFGKVA